MPGPRNYVASGENSLEPRRSILKLSPTGTNLHAKHAAESIRLLKEMKSRSNSTGAKTSADVSRGGEVLCIPAFSRPRGIPFLPLCAYCTGLSASLVLSVPPMDYRAHSRSTHNAGTRTLPTSSPSCPLQMKWYNHHFIYEEDLRTRI